MHMCYNVLHHWGGLGPKLEGSGLGEHPKKFGTPYLFLQSLKLATEKLVQVYLAKRKFLVQNK